VDERDCRILMELVRAPFETFEGVGARVGVTGTAVKARLARMEKAGIYAGLAVGPAPHALGKHARLAVFAQGGPLVEGDLAALCRVDEVAWAARAYPTASVAMLYRDDPGAPVPESLVKAAGRAPDTLVVPADPRVVAQSAPLSPLDWRVMRAVMQEPRASASRLGVLSGLSAKVAKERRDRMLAEGALMAFPVVDATREEGAFLYSAYVGAQSPDALRGVRLPNAHRIVTHHEPPGAYLMGYVRTYAEAHVVEEKLRAMDGVADVTFSVPQGTLLARERLDAWVGAQIERWAQARRAAR